MMEDGNARVSVVGIQVTGETGRVVDVDSYAGDQRSERYGP